jgi:hypothetical protein
VTNALPLEELAMTAVQEEAAEVSIEVSKGRRFGWHDVNPLTGTTPAQRLSTEFGDFLGSMDFFDEVHPGVIDRELVEKAWIAKKQKLLDTNDPAKVEAWKDSVVAAQLR